MVVVWYLLMLVPVFAVVYFIWAYQKRAFDRAGASRERFEKLLGVGQPATAQREPAEPAAGIAGAAPTPIARERFLTRPEALLYYLLKAGAPGHEVFAHVALASVVGVAQGSAAPEREQQLRRLSLYQLDFVVCDKNMRVVAAVELESAQAAAAAGLQRFKADCLKAAGIRLVRVNPAALPRRDAVRALVLGGDG